MVSEEELANMSPEEVAELQKKNCIFCKIISGEVPGKKVFEDEHMMAILDIRPAAKGHLLVMPKEHYPILPLVPPHVFTHMFRTTKDLCSAVRRGVPSLGTSVFIANGAAAGQQSPHFLLHIIPRDAGDGLPLDLPESNIDQSEVADTFKQILNAMMQKYLAAEGKLTTATEESKVKLAQILEENPQVKELLVNNTEEFKKALEGNPQLAKLFEGLDVDALAEKLREGEAVESHEEALEDLAGGDDEDKDEDPEEDDDSEEDNDDEDEGSDDEEGLEKDEGDEDSDEEKDSKDDEEYDYGPVDLDKIAGMFI